MRLGGIATGLDTDSMVKEMMKAHQTKVDRAKQDKVLIEYKQELYRDIMKDMKDIYTKYFDISSNANKSTNLILNSNYQTIKFTSSDEGVVTAKGLAGAKTGKYDVQVEQLAKASSMTLGQNDLKSITADANGVKSFDLELGKDKSVNVVITDEMIDSNGDINIRELAKAINSSIESYNKNNDNKEKIEVKVEYSELGNNIRISGTKTGEANDIELGISSQGNEISLEKAKEKATDAIVHLVDVNGNKETVKKESNQFTIDNIQYTINSVSEKDENGEFKTTYLRRSNNTDSVVENVRNFVTDYNKMIDKINSKLVEKRDKSYMPLTEDQKKEMSETEIKLWEQKTKTGLLRGDDILQTALNKMLGVISSNTSGFQLSSIGISPYSDYRTGKGKIELDEDKLIQALTQNGEETRKKLTETFESLKDTLYDTAVSSNSYLAKRAGYEGTVTSINNEMTKKMEEKQKSIDKLVKNLKAQEEKYYLQFSRLEVAMNKANAQMSQFMQSVG